MAKRSRGQRRPRSERRRRPRVEVRETRHGRELIIDDTFASLLRDGEIATGSVWDAIAAPLLLVPPERRKRILILGYGGGSAARIARAFAPKAKIVGVEFDAAVIEAARKAFGADELGVELVHADAREYLAKGRGRFDVVIEDVFIGRGDAVHKPAWLPEPGLTLLARRLAPGGLLVSNTIDETAFVAAALAERFRSVVATAVDAYDNCVLAATDQRIDAKALRRAVRQDEHLRPTLSELHFRTLK